MNDKYNLSLTIIFNIGVININSTYNLKNHHSPLYESYNPIKFNINCVKLNLYFPKINPPKINMKNTNQYFL